MAPRSSLLVLLICAAWCGGGEAPTQFAEERVAWTSSRITGSPDPPPPYRTERLFESLTFERPVDISSAPGTERLFVAEQGGRIFSFSRADRQPQLLLDLSGELKTLGRIPQSRGFGALYGITFHPRFAENRYCYVFYVLAPKNGQPRLSHGTRISRFTVSREDPPRASPESEQILLEWLEGGHNGGCLKFGPDGYLYISAGDAEVPSPPDPLKTGQDITDLLSSILRIDVDCPANGSPYAVPPDNPFVHHPGARPEVWSYGYRNPWRMSFDRQTGELWVGDVGWEAWEMVYRVERGGNYGWSIVEGPQPIHPDGERGPTPILPPTIAIPHPEAASVTGGYVYRGRQLPELFGHYVYGDWETRRIWANAVDGTEVGPRREIARTDLRIIGFAEDHSGELYILDHEGGGIHQLTPDDAGGVRNEKFPRKLSHTGLFTNVGQRLPAPGVVPFAIQAEQWADGATAERFIAVPPGQPVVIADSRSALFPGKQVVFPRDSVLAKTFSLEGRPVETQILHFDGRSWNGYSYAWDEQQSDAELVDSSGGARVLELAGGKQLWRFQARAQCATCHNPWARFTLAFNASQLDRNIEMRGESEHQLDRLIRLDLAPREWAQRSAMPLVDPHDPAAPLERRARSYLHVNCAHCHQFGGGGSALIDLRHDLPIEQTKTLDASPVQGAFGIEDARIIAPAQPYRSVLLYRMARLGPGRMPQVGSEQVDLRGLELIERWIAGIESPAASPRPVEPSLDSTAGALALARAIDHGAVSPQSAAEAIARGADHRDDAIRGLFERFSASEPQPDLLGDSIDARALLAIPGDPQRGRKIFLEDPAAATCRTCHTVASGTRTTVGPGPDLSRIGGKYSRAELLDQILQPSLRVDEPYVLHLVEATGGVAYSGFIVGRDDQQITLEDLSGQQRQIPLDRVVKLTRQNQSTMPPQLLRYMTAQQAADLLSFLASLK